MIGNSLLKKTFYVVGILAFIGVLLLEAGHFYVILKHYPPLTVIKPADYNFSISDITVLKDPLQIDKPTNSGANPKSLEHNSETKVSPEYYLGEITNFYGNIIVILFSTIGVLLAISFIYVYTVSRGKAEDLARQALSEEPFQIVLHSKIEKSLAELKNQGDIAVWIDKMEDFDERIFFLEKAVNDKGYGGQIIEQKELEGEDTGGSNKAIQSKPTGEPSE